MPLPEDLVRLLPEGSEVQEIAYVVGASSTQNVVVELPAPINRRAVLLEPVQTRVEGESSLADLVLVAVPLVEQESDSLLVGLRQWVDAAGDPEGTPPSLMMTFQGAEIFWSRSRIAVRTDPERFEGIRNALIETTYYLSALSSIESELKSNWPELDDDLPLAFQFNERSRHRLKELQQRARNVLALRSRLARITPFLLSPHVYPPTLASQISERLRERTHVYQREECLSDQIEVFEDVYEMCSQRASEFMLARAGHTLEWIIIVLLAAQILLSVFEIISSAGT